MFTLFKALSNATASRAIVNWTLMGADTWFCTQSNDLRSFKQNLGSLTEKHGKNPEVVILEPESK